MSNVNFQLHCDNFGRLVLTDAEGVRHEGVTPVRAFPIAAPEEGLSLINFEGHEVGWVDRVADLPPAARAAWLAWYATTPDTPCIAICSTAQGDALCKGCGRTEDEVQRWPALSPFARRAVWRRITQQGTAWRFNRYAERAAEAAASR